MCLEEMSSPRCPICQNHYSSSRVPYIMQPCSHGICKDCAIAYFDDRLETSCPLCRATVLRRTVNYDLKEMYSTSLEGWKKSLHDLLRRKPDLKVNITDDILPAAPLLVNRLTGDRDVHQSLVTLVRHTTSDDAYMWVKVLNFPEDWDMTRKVDRVISQCEFLDKYNASWVMEYT